MVILVVEQLIMSVVLLSKPNQAIATCLLTARSCTYKSS